MVVDERLLDSVVRSVGVADHLTVSDDGAVSAALGLAQLIDEQLSAEALSGDMLKTLNASYQTLQRYLTDLGLNPQGRRNLGVTGGEDSDDGW